MKVVDPKNLIHKIQLIPRSYNVKDLNLYLYNEQTKITTELVDIDFEIRDGIMSIIFSFDFDDKSKFEMKITEDSNVIYRGKIIATTQESQDYKLSKNLYFYE